MTRATRSRGTFANPPTVYGRSVEGAPLHVWLPPGGGAEVLVFAGIHGEEPDSTVLLSRALRSRGRPSRTCAVVLCANPDGVQHGTRGNANGVDLNRNFPASNWRPDPVLHRWTVDSARNVELSPGGAPGSEPEVAALLELVADLQPECVVSIHSPLALIDDPDDTDLGRVLAEKSGLPRSALPLEETPGSFGSWAKDAGIPAITYELPDTTVWNMLPVHLPLLCELLDKGLAIARR